jgi:hypothetical protein
MYNQGVPKMLIIKVLTTPEIEYSSGEEVSELIEHLGNLDNKESLHEGVNETFEESGEFNFPTIKSLLNNYESIDIHVVLQDKSEWIQENHPYKDFSEVAKNDSCYWNEILNEWSVPYTHEMFLIIGELKLEPSSFGWSDLSMLPRVQTYLNKWTEGENKVILDISPNNPLALHFFHWGMKALEKGMDVEFIQQVMDKDGRLEVVSQFI